VKGREILLVDDVLTTGATASECARELRQAGASRVWVATPARALGRVALESLEEPVRDALNLKAFSSNRSSLSDSSPGTAQVSLLQRRGIPLSYGEQRVDGE